MCPPDLEYRPTRSRIQAHPISNRGPSDLEYRPTRSWIQAQPISNRGPPDLEYRPTRSWIQAQPIMNTGPPNLYLDTSVSDPLSFFTDLDPDLDPTQNQRILAESWQKFKVSKFLSFFWKEKFCGFPLSIKKRLKYSNPWTFRRNLAFSSLHLLKFCSKMNNFWEIWLLDPDPDRLKRIRIRPNETDPYGSGSGSATLKRENKTRSGQQEQEPDPKHWYYY